MLKYNSGSPVGTLQCDGCQKEVPVTVWDYSRTGAVNFAAPTGWTYTAQTFTDSAGGKHKAYGHHCPACSDKPKGDFAI